MAVRGSFQVNEGMTAGADLSSSQYLFIEQGGTVCNAVTDVPRGVLQNTPTSGQTAELVVLGYTKIIASAAITAGALIGTTTAGKAVALVPGTDTTAYIVGRAITGASGDGIVIEALVNCISPARAQ